MRSDPDHGTPGVVAALARPAKSDAPFLGRHHLEAAVRVQRLFARAHLVPSLTMRYEPVPRAGRGTGNGAADITDSAASARKALAALHHHLPGDCASVLIDVCGYEKGLQAIETERGWPRRSAKLVLRIALDCLAEHYGLGPYARGPGTAATRFWGDEDARPTEIG